MPLAAPYAVAIFLSGSSSSGNGQIVLADERAMIVGAVDTASEHHDAPALQVAEAVAKRARLLGASGRVVLRIEIQHDFVAVIVG